MLQAILKLGQPATNNTDICTASIDKFDHRNFPPIDTCIILQMAMQLPQKTNIKNY